MGDVRDLCYNVITKEGIACRFVPTPEGLHTLDVDKDTDRCIFGKEIIDNHIDGGDSMCHLILEDSSSDADNSDDIVKKVQITGVSESSEDYDIIGVNDIVKKAQFTGVSESSRDYDITGVNEEDAIDTIEGSKYKFTRRDQIKAQMVRRF